MFLSSPPVLAALCSNLSRARPQGGWVPWSMDQDETGGSLEVHGSVGRGKSGANLLAEE